MKLYISDLHIGNGSSKDDFVYDENLIYILKNMKFNELFFVGDIFELIAGNNTSLLNTAKEYIDNFNVSELKNVYNKHQQLFDTINKISKKSKIRYIIGNHDYYIFHNEKLQQTIKDFMGNIEFFPYYYDKKCKIFIIHGNQFDPMNRFAIDKENNILPSFGEYMMKYMEENFDSTVNDILPDELISDYDNISPILDVFQWLDYINERYNLKCNLKSLWSENFINFVRTPQIKKWLKVSFPKYSILTNVFVNKIGGMKFGEFLVRTIMLFRGFKKTNSLLLQSKKLLLDDFYIPKKNLIGYTDKSIRLDSKDINGIIMGHNHQPTHKILKNAYTKKFYANTGAWKHIVSKNFGINENEFIRKNVISYLCIEENLKVKLYTEESYFGGGK
ncbi:UDP-2,3-diacylglucosamine hydrolase [Tepiditoga spiralis]|uniref:UDP-2,3-diacylglucosamine hydrolase n=1 Tax=Tepiditoga spiralis TaxID=2108365 RepID=A0A7G1G478_9BACT|nr:metallophosphoesterase [Tepiditoga spiralis]BBE30016.1 UDP-2,3-diacylglucosamine hydrolase [Tepiditoga spiralis]